MLGGVSIDRLLRTRIFVKVSVFCLSALFKNLVTSGDLIWLRVLKLTTWLKCKGRTELPKIVFEVCHDGSYVQACVNLRLYVRYI